MGSAHILERRPQGRDFFLKDDDLKKWMLHSWSLRYMNLEQMTGLWAAAGN